VIDFKGRVAIVFGAAGGIGLAAAQHFVRDGAAVVLVDRDGERVTRAAEQPRGEPVPDDADVPDRSQVEAIAEEAWARVGSVDVLVKNAGIAGGAVPRWELTNEDWESVLALNLTGAFYCTCVQPPWGSAAGATS
jgi:NAD(P)-dependent dehydrogenase (short-subunit alcohol dehydrogenase family)